MLVSRSTAPDPLEEQYVELRPQIEGILSAAFGDAVDREEIYQEAWTELLELQRRGTRVRNVRGMLRTIAWRRARDRLRSRRAQPLDPGSPVLANHASSAPATDEAAQVHVDAGAVRMIVESLDERQAMVFKLRHEAQLELRQIRALLGMSTKTLDHLMTRAQKSIEAKLASDGDGPTEWERRQRSLLLLCLLGNASPRQVARARRMIAQDARCRAMLAELRATLDNVAAVLPVPVIVEHEQERGLAVLDRLHDVLGASKAHSAEFASRWTDKLPPGEQVAAGGATAVGAGAAKIALSCLAAGTAAVCLAPALLPSPPHHPGSLHDKAPKTASASPKREPRPVRTAVTQPTRMTAPTTKAPTKTRKTTQRSPNQPAAPSPAPPGATEFGPGNVGSQAASQAPTAAPTTGGGEFTP